MIIKKAAKKKLKELQNNEIGSGTQASSLGKLCNSTSCGTHTKAKPTLEQLDRMRY